MNQCARLLQFGLSLVIANTHLSVRIARSTSSSLKYMNSMTIRRRLIECRLLEHIILLRSWFASESGLGPPGLYESFAARSGLIFKNIAWGFSRFHPFTHFCLASMGFSKTSLFQPRAYQKAVVSADAVFDSLLSFNYQKSCCAAFSKLACQTSIVFAQLSVTWKEASFPYGSLCV